MKKAFEILILALLFMGIVLSPARIPTASAASQTDISNAIEEGLAYLNSTQASDGSWGSSSYPVACTAMAVLSFENAPKGHYGWNLTDPYHTTVQKGLDWLFSVGQNVTISNQDAGNPDTNANGIGIYWYYDGHFVEIYESPMVLMAIVASQAPTNVTNPGPLGVRTYHDIAVDIVDYLAWSQNDPTPSYPQCRGGWGYYANRENDADNSNSGWPVLGLMAAELWGINAPAFVKSELNYWVAACQDLTGNSNSNSLYGSFGYNGRDMIYGGVAEASAGILQLTYIGAPPTNASIIAAEGYINKMWLVNDGNWNVNIGNLYCMYAAMKAFREATPPIQFVANYDGSNGVEWYNGTGQYADSLIANQGSNGSWVNWHHWEEADEYPPELTTALGVLILEFVPVRVAYKFAVKVVDAVSGNPINGAAVLANGPETHAGNTGVDGKIDFGSVQAGSYQVSASATGYIPSAIATVLVTKDTVFTILLQPLTPRPVGGFSVSLAKHASFIQMAAFMALISLFAVAVIVGKRKRK